MLSPTAAFGPLVLVIDDDIRVCGLVGAILEALDVRIEAAHDGRDGLDRALSLCPDVVIVDQELPGIDGATVIRTLRTTPRTCGLPIIAVTGGGPTVEELAVRAGATVVLRKPIRPSALTECVRKLLESHTPAPGQYESG